MCAQVNGTLIWKPNEGSQGAGIHLMQTKGDLARRMKSCGYMDDVAIVQRYIADPFLLDGFKFDLRLYILILSIHPLKLFLCREGIVRSLLSLCRCCCSAGPCRSLFVVPFIVIPAAVQMFWTGRAFRSPFFFSSQTLIPLLPLAPCALSGELPTAVGCLPPAETMRSVER